MDPNAELLLKDVQKVVGDYLKQRKSHTLLSLARKTGVSYATVRRMQHGEVLGSALTVIAIINEALEPDKRLPFVQKHFPEMARTIKTQVELQQANHKMDRDLLPRLLSEQPQGEIFFLIKEGVLTNRSDIKVHFGEVGIQALYQLIEADFVSRKSSRYIANFQLADLWNAEAIAVWENQVLANLSRLGWKNGKDKLFTTDLSGLNAEGIKKLLQLTRGFQNRYDKIIDDPQFLGKNQVALSLDFRILGEL